METNKLKTFGKELAELIKSEERTVERDTVELTPYDILFIRGMLNLEKKRLEKLLDKPNATPIEAVNYAYILTLLNSFENATKKDTNETTD